MFLLFFGLIWGVFLSAPSERDVLNGEIAGSTWYVEEFDSDYTFSKDGSVTIDGKKTGTHYEVEPIPNAGYWRGTVTMSGTVEGKPFSNSFSAAIYRDGENAVKMDRLGAGVSMSFILK